MDEVVEDEKAVDEESAAFGACALVAFSSRADAIYRPLHGSRPRSGRRGATTDATGA
jgi:hypothetical protein